MKRVAEHAESFSESLFCQIVLSEGQQRFALNDADRRQARGRASASGFAIFECMFEELQGEVGVRAVAENGCMQLSGKRGIFLQKSGVLHDTHDSLTS